jgi:hypothetical protein
LKLLLYPPAWKDYHREIQIERAMNAHVMGLKLSEPCDMMTSAKKEVGHEKNYASSLCLSCHSQFGVGPMGAKNEGCGWSTHHHQCE